LKKENFLDIIAPLWRKDDRAPTTYFVAAVRKVQAAEGRVVAVKRHAKALVRATETTTHFGPDRFGKESEKRQSSPLQPPTGSLLGRLPETQG